MGYFPFFIDIENKKILVVGGGRVASRKIEKLSMFNPQITVVAPQVCDEIRTFRNLIVNERNFMDDDINGCFAVVSATNDGRLNEHIFELCRERKCPVNTVDNKELCTFIFPAIAKSENAAVAVSTEGKSPLSARYLREKNEEILSGSLDVTIELLGRVREYVKQRLDTEEKRKDAFERIFKLSLCSSSEVTEGQIENIIEDLK